MCLVLEDIDFFFVCIDLLFIFYPPVGEIKNRHEPPAGRNFFFAIFLSKKIYDKNI